MPPTRKKRNEEKPNGEFENLRFKKIGIAIRIQMFKNLRDKIKCSECFKLPRPNELMRMKRLKLFCPKCYDEDSDDDEDEEEAPAESLTNKLLRDELPFQCKYTDFGCNVILMPDDLSIHETEECQYFQTHCAVLTCKDPVGNLHYLNHLERYHQDLKTVEKDEDNKFKIHTNVAEFDGPLDPLDDYRGPLKVVAQRRLLQNPEEDEYKARLILNTKKFTAFDRNFFEVCVVEKELVYRWIYGHFSPTEAKHFQFRYVLKNDEKGAEVVFSGKVHSLNQDPDSIMESQENVFVTGIKAVQKMSNEDNMVTFEITVRNLKEEAKDPDLESGISDSEIE